MERCGCGKEILAGSTLCDTCDSILSGGLIINKCFCGAKASYGDRATKLRLRCKTHKFADDINTLANYCRGESGKCLTQASFGAPEAKKATHCKLHSLPGQVCKVIKLCKHKGCSKQPYFGPKDGKATYCKEHAPQGYINIKSKRCRHPNCGVIPSFGPPGGRPEYCKDHALPGYENVSTKRCKNPECRKQATHGFHSIPEYCGEHAPEGYRNIKAKRCEFLGCDKIPVYGQKGGAATYCKNHKPDNYLNVKSRKCAYPGCETQAHYGSSDKKEKYCVTHKSDNDRDPHSYTCKAGKCIRRASFAKLNQHPEFCAMHRPDGYDLVVSNLCEFEGCGKYAKVGPLFQRKRHCIGHAATGEYKNNTPTCIADGCSSGAYYSEQPGTFPSLCSLHKKDGFVNVVERRCSLCDLPDIIHPDFELCNDCRGFTQEPVRKKKEMEVKELLDRNGISYISHDRRIPDGCSKYRPDFVMETPTFNVILECDENQHSSYPKACEVARMIQIFQDYGGKSLAFVRYNPDGYLDENGEKVNRPGNRKDVLVKTIREILKRETLKYPISVIYICYNGYPGKPVMKYIDYDRYIECLSAQKS